MNPNLQMFGQMAQQPPQMPPQPQAQPPGPQQGAQQMTPQLLAQLQQRMGQQPQQQRFTPQEMAQLGRFGDSIMAHQTPGEITVPLPVQSPKVLATLKQAFHKQHADMSQFVAGSPNSRINPKTGAPEYYMSWLAPALGAVGSVFAGPFGYLAGSAIGGAIAGKKNSQVVNSTNQLPLPSGFTNGMTPTSQLGTPQQILGQPTYNGPVPTAYPGNLNRYGFGPGFNFMQQPPAPVPSTPAPTPSPSAATQPQIMPLTGAFDPSNPSGLPPNISA